MVSSNKNTEGYNKTGLKLLTARVECKTEEEPMEGERDSYFLVMVWWVRAGWAEPGLPSTAIAHCKMERERERDIF